MKRSKIIKSWLDHHKTSMGFHLSLMDSRISKIRSWKQHRRKQST
jgi:hypothetical protein